MAGKSHPYLRAAVASALVFFASVVVIVFIALYVNSVVAHGGDMPEEAVAENITPPGRVYPRQ